MKKPLLVSFLLLTLILGACGGGSLEGEEVTITGALIGVEQDLFRAAFESFTEETGIIVSYTGSDNFEQEIQIQMESGDTPDFALWPQPGGLVDAANRGYHVPLEDLGIDIADYRDNYSSYLVGLGEVDGVVYGGVGSVNLKSLVWYQPEEFAARGYEVPETWDQMIALADQIVADGMTPFCFGMYSNGASGWLATDWMEDIMLRTGNGTDSYDKWVTNELAMTDPIVKNAATLLSQIMHTEDYVAGGTDAIVSTFFGNAQDPMFSKDANGNPGCFMHRQASFITAFWPEGEQEFAGSKTTVFGFPVIDPSLPKAALGAGDMWGAFNDREATKAVAAYMLELDFFDSIAESPQNSRLSGHAKYPSDRYGSDLYKEFGNIVSAALSENAFRFDASDLMPPEVGAGSFWKEMMNLAVEGPGYVDTALDEIQKSWP